MHQVLERAVMQRTTQTMMFGAILKRGSDVI